VLYGFGGQRHAPAALPPGKIRYPLYRRLGGPQDRSEQVRKISPPPGFDPRTVQPVASRYTDCAVSAHCEISYENENDIQQKLAKFAQILGILNDAFEPTLIWEFSRIEVYNALAVPVILYRSEIWTIRNEDKKD